jgi:2',3'-cyclic-nucleotide 2'-phosphodiesterase (5'-nucleotidase family)
VAALLLAAACALGFLAPSCSSNRGFDGTGRVVFVYTNSHRGEAEATGGTGGLAARATLIAEIRAEVGDLALVVDVGNLVSGSLTTLDRVARGAPEILAMDALDYDALAVGPEDFAFGIQNINNLTAGPNVLDFSGAPTFPVAGLDSVDFTRGAGFPFLTANLVEKSSGNAPFPLQGGPILLRSGSVRIGLFAITSGDAIPSGRIPSDLELKASVQAGLDAIARMPADVDMIVALHNGDDVEADALLRGLPDLDVLIGGGDGDFSGIYTRSDSLSGTTVPGVLSSVVASPDGVFVRTATQGAAVGRLDLDVTSGTVVRAEVTNIPVTGFAEDAAVSALLEPFQDRRDQAEAIVLPAVIGTASVSLEGDTALVREQETNWGDFVADAVLAAAPGSEAVLLSAGVFRKTIPSGTVTQGQVFDALPTNEQIVLLDLSGTELLEALEQAVSDVPGEAFCQVGGMTFVWKPALAVGQRVSDVKVGGVALVTTQTYRVAVNESIAGGDEGFTVLATAANQTFTGDLISTVAIAAVSAQPQPFGPVTDARIQEQ